MFSRTCKHLSFIVNDNDKSAVDEKLNKIVFKWTERICEEAKQKHEKLASKLGKGLDKQMLNVVECLSKIGEKQAIAEYAIVRAELLINQDDQGLQDSHMSESMCPPPLFSNSGSRKQPILPI